MSLNTRLGWKGLPGASTLTHYGNPKITAVKSYMIQAPGANGIKFFNGRNL